MIAEKRQIWYACAGLFAVTLLLYSHTLQVPFYMDDYPRIVRNDHLMQLSDMKAVLFGEMETRSVVMLSLAINYYLHQFEVPGYHVVNIMLHFMVGLSAFFLVKRLSSFCHDLSLHSNLFAFFTASFFLAHPLQTQAVNYIIQRAELLASLFIVLSIIYYLKYRMSTTRKYLFLSVLFYFISLNCKEYATILPFILFCVDRFFLRVRFNGSSSLSQFRALIPYFFLSGIFLAYFALSPLKGLVGEQKAPLVSVQYFVTQVQVILKYLSLIVFPVGQNFDHHISAKGSGFDISTIFSIFFLLTIILVVVIFRKRHNLFSFGAFWFFVFLAPTSSFIATYDPMVEHRLYLPILGFLLASLAIMNRFLPTKLQYSLLAVLFLLCTTLTIQRNSLWNDPTAFFLDSARKSPQKARVWNNLGFAYRSKDMLDEAISAYKKAIDLNPEYVSAYVNLGVAYAHKNNLRDAIDCYEKAIALKPYDETAHFNMAVALFTLNDWSSANRFLDKARKLGYPEPEGFLKLFETR
jgi:hypothetical protein